MNCLMMDTIKCACGCGRLRPKYDSRGTLRKYIHGHNRGGMPVSEESRRKKSEKLKGHAVSIEARRKMSLASRGRIPSEETRRKMSAAHKGRIVSEATRRKISKGNKGRKHSEEIRKRMSEAHKGQRAWNKGMKLPPLSEETRRKIGKAHTGEKSHFWRGGISFEPYGSKFNSALKRQIRERDNYTCQMCFELGNFVHHIDYDKKSNDPSNLITLCNGCHSKTNYNREYWIKCFENKVPQVEEMLVVA